MVIPRIDLGIDEIEVLGAVVPNLFGVALEGDVLNHPKYIHNVITLLLMIRILGLYERPDGGIVLANGVVYVKRVFECEVESVIPMYEVFAEEEVDVVLVVDGRLALTGGTVLARDMVGR